MASDELLGNQLEENPRDWRQSIQQGVSPLWIGVAIALLPPLGIILLLKHPVLSQSEGWKRVAYAWGAIWLIGQVSNLFRDGPNKPVPGVTDKEKPVPVGSSESVAKEIANPNYMRGWRATYAGGQRMGVELRRARSMQAREFIEERIEEQEGAIRMTLFDLEQAGIVSGSQYDFVRGQLDGYRAGVRH